MHTWQVVFMMLAACGYPPLADVPDARGAIDAPSCFGSFVPICFTEVPTAPVMLNEFIDLDTDASPMCDQHNDQAARYCVVAGSTVTLTSTGGIGPKGSKPLVLLSSSTLVLQGAVDATSYHYGAQRRAAGASPAGLCGAGQAAVGASGGAGGSFGGAAGNGEPVDGAAGLAAPASAAPAILRGGCAGGDGDGEGGAGGVGGNGGGAVLIIATELHLEGTINASGAGGGGGPALKSGGGGGGSGGMIVLDAASILTSGNPRLLATGGGGGQGGTGPGTGVGIGDDGNEAGVPGNNTTKGGGVGGAGATGTKLGGSNATGGATTGGGGGGGGAAGVIYAPGLSAAVFASPPVTSR